MEFIIQSYLSRYYEIKTSELGNDGIYSKEDTRRYPTPYYQEKLLKELNTVFSISDDESRILINNWAVSLKEDVDLEFYWKEVEDFLGMPMIRRVAAQTVGLDLVAVQPMSPTGNLEYYRYIADTAPIRPDRQAMIDELVRNQQRYLEEE